MKNQELVDYLRSCGICSACQLRYLKARGNEYSDIKNAFQKLDIDWSNDCENGMESKKQRLHTCPTCLGLFSAKFQSELVTAILAADILKFETDSIAIAITMPMLLQIRQLSMWFALIRQFGERIDSCRAPDVPLKEAVKLILNPIICKQLKKDYNCNGVMVNITLDHSQEVDERSCLQRLNTIAFPVKKGKRPEVSRGLLEKQYTPNNISVEMFAKYFPIPPSIPNESLSLGNISLTGPTVFVAGRYRKVSRVLSHTPWVLNGVRVMEDSIEEIIIRSVVPFFCVDSSKVIFMSSGREDVDVRCLGKGRPFVLEIPNALHTLLPKKIAHNMEQEIENSLKVSVRDLQMVQRSELVHIKTGEEQKRKYYRALCALATPATVELLEKLNLPKGFEIQQKTPIRVLHRRPLHTRPRQIFSLKGYVQKDNHRILVLDIISQAGTYIKELVHGEFGRTSPSIRTIIGQHIDIIALDVIGIDLEWPMEVDNSQY